MIDELKPQNLVDVLALYTQYKPIDEKAANDHPNGATSKRGGYLYSGLFQETLENHQTGLAILKKSSPALFERKLQPALVAYL